MELTGRQKRHLRALAHHLKARVAVGKNGLAGGVLEQVEANLLSHELVKVKLLKTCPLDEEACVEAVSGHTGAVLAQRIGRTLLFYRSHPEAPVIRLPLGREE
jgi:RNA-binding protein